MRSMLSRVLLRGVAFVAIALASSNAGANLLSSVLPASRSAEVGVFTTFFATVINTASTEVSGCRVELLSDIPADLQYQRTDPATNLPIGDPDTPHSIPAGAPQSYLLALTASAPIAPLDVEFAYVCADAGPATIVRGLNTLAFSASDTPTPDVVALAATPTADGITVMPPTGNFGVFAVATVNVGSAGTLTVGARATGVAPSQLLVAETDPLTGGYVTGPAPAVTVTVAENATPTFSVFVLANADVPLDAAANRVYLEFVDDGALRGSTSVAFKSADSLDWFTSNVAVGVVQEICAGCHVDGGVAQATPLVFQVGSTPANTQANHDVFARYVADDQTRSQRILNKVLGALDHGGQTQLGAESDGYRDLCLFLGLLAEGDGCVTESNLFDGVGLMSRQRTLWRAALLFAGRAPTDAERASAVDDAGLRTAVRGVMQGDNFHEFLLESANDRLLTDRQLSVHHQSVGEEGFFVAHTNESYNLRAAAVEANPDDPDWDIYWGPQHLKIWGWARAPIELVAHVVENDLPYTEVLTADYVMANPWAAASYGDDTVMFDDSQNPREFRPAHVLSYYRNHATKQWSEYHPHPDVSRWVVDPGILHTPIPHAGVLNTMAFLTRYPSTATNRNRARARWTYYHFLGEDLETRGRTIDPDALADRDNPTLNNTNCTVCHADLDPVAGLFQNYGDIGNYRDSDDGYDSLDPVFKDSHPHYTPGDRWYGDMRTPSFDGLTPPDADTSLQWLARQIVTDPRFAPATVKFWWPAVMGRKPLVAPAVETDVDFAARLTAFNAQQAEVARLADAFRDGIAGGPAHNLKDLIVEMVMSTWFRAERVASDTGVDRLAALEHVGSERLLTPEQLARKTLALTGTQWGRVPDEVWFRFRRHLLDDDFRLFYGGIDSDGTIERGRDLTAVMAGVAQRQAADLGCPIAYRELILAPQRRVLLTGVDLNVTPDLPGTDQTSGSAAIKNDIRDVYARLFGLDLPTEHPDIERAYRLFVDLWQNNVRDGGHFFGSRHGCHWWTDFHYLDGVIDYEHLVLYDDNGYPTLDISTGVAQEFLLATFDHSDPHGIGRTWASMLTYFLMDYRFLFL